MRSVWQREGLPCIFWAASFKAVTEAIVGEEAVAALEKYNFTKGFWGANGVSLQKGYSTPELKEAMVKKKSMGKLQGMFCSGRREQIQSDFQCDICTV